MSSCRATCDIHPVVSCADASATTLRAHRPAAVQGGGPWRSRAVRFATVALAWGVLALPFDSTAAWNQAHADSLEDFEDAHRPRSRRNRNRNRPPGSAGPVPVQTQVQVTPQYGPGKPSPSVGGSLLALMLVGDLPGRGFSFGLSPYSGRGPREVPDQPTGPQFEGIGATGQGLVGYATDWSQFEAAPEPPPLPCGPKPGHCEDAGWKPGMNAPPAVAAAPTERTTTVVEAAPETTVDEGPPLDLPRARHFHLEVRGAPTWNLDSETNAMGYDAFARFETTWTPAFSYWRQALVDNANADALSIDVVAIEPRWVTHRSVMVHGILGGVFLANEEGLFNAGGIAGISITAFPARPIVLETRLAMQVYGLGLNSADLFLGLGVEVFPTTTIMAGYRFVGNEAAALHLATVGLRFDLGF